MNERSTPETDAEVGCTGFDLETAVSANFARKLERERDEALEKAAFWEKLALREASINGARMFGKEKEKLEGAK